MSTTITIIDTDTDTAWEAPIAAWLDANGYADHEAILGFARARRTLLGCPLMSQADRDVAEIVLFDAMFPV